MADALTGFYAAYGILGALHERHRTGLGRAVDVSMLEAMCHFNLDAFTHYFAEGEVMTPYSRPSVSQSYVLECGDGKWIALHMSSPEKFWQGLANAIGQPDLLRDERFSSREKRIDHQEQLIDLLGNASSSATATPGAGAWKRRTCPTRPCTTAAKRCATPGPASATGNQRAPSRRRRMAHGALAGELRPPAAAHRERAAGAG